jgi:hypothetical protein
LTEAAVEIDDMNAEARRVVELAREARTPREADKRRVRQAIALGLGAATAGAASSVAASAVVKGGAAGIFAGLRGVAMVVAVATAGAGTAWWAHARGQARGSVGPAVTAPAPTPMILVPLPSVEPVGPAEAPPADPLVAEVSLLRQAQQALRDGQAAQALALARRHATLYPRSQMSLEGGALQVFSFCALGRKNEAHRLATELLARAPRSPLRTSLEESCAITPRR